MYYVAHDLFSARSRRDLGAISAHGIFCQATGVILLTMSTGMADTYL